MKKFEFKVNFIKFKSENITFYQAESKYTSQYVFYFSKIVFVFDFFFIIAYYLCFFFQVNKFPIDFRTN